MPGKKMMGYQKGGDVKKKDKKKDKKGKVDKMVKDTMKKAMPTAPNNTSAPLPKPQAAPKPPMGGMGGGMPPMGGAPAPAGGMGMPPKKPPMPMMKAGGKVKKKAKSKSYGKGGKVRGCGIAKKGVRPAQMR